MRDQPVAGSSVVGPLQGLLPRSRTARRGLAVGSFALLTALSARVVVPLPGTTVPFTLQVIAVLLSGALLGPRLGAAAQGLYLAAGAAGLPVFAAGGGLPYLLGPTGGYLLAYPAAAAAVGALSGGGGTLRKAAALAAGVAVIHAGGAAWLSVLTTPEQAVAQGVVPFLLADAAKAVFVLLLIGRLQAPSRRLLE